MPKYVVNQKAQNNGDHEVHKVGCTHMPLPTNCYDLGEHRNCQEAVTAAKRIYRQSNGCYYCSEECHTQ